MVMLTFTREYEPHWDTTTPSSYASPRPATQDVLFGDFGEAAVLPCFGAAACKEPDIFTGVWGEFPRGSMDISTMLLMDG